MKCAPALLILCLASAPALAASGVTSAYDGVYLAAVRTSAGGCPAFDIGRVTISQGALHSEPGAPAINGFITEEGYVQATMDHDGVSGALDGRLADDMISAGYMAGGCSWIVELRPAT